MTDPALEHRVTELETKLMYQDDLLKTLNDVIVDLRAELETLNQRVKFLEQGGQGDEENAVRGNEKPPHY